MADDPIGEKYHAMMNGLAAGIDKILNGDSPKPKIAFVLLMCEFNYDEGDEEGRANYISNANRDDIVKMMKEFIARQETKQ